MYEYDQISTPSFTNQFVKCTRVSTSNFNWCTYLGYPVNTVVEYSYLGSFATSVSSVINMTNGKYSGTFTAVARVFSSSYVTIMKNSFNVVYTPYTITSFSFAKEGSTTIYKGS